MSNIKDLDKIAQEAVLFKLHGKIHKISPMTTFQFFSFSQALSNLHEISKNKEITKEQFEDAYYVLVKNATKSKTFFGSRSTITRDDIKKCSAQQLSALTKLILQTVTGEKDEDTQKKNQ